MGPLHPGDGVLGGVTAVQDCEAAIRLEPGLVKAQLRRAAALRGLGRLEEAKEGYRRVLNIDPSCEDAKKGLEELENATIEKEKGNER